MLVCHLENVSVVILILSNFGLVLNSLLLIPVEQLQLKNSTIITKSNNLFCFFVCCWFFFAQVTQNYLKLYVHLKHKFFNVECFSAIQTCNLPPQWPCADMLQSRNDSLEQGCPPTTREDSELFGPLASFWHNNSETTSQTCTPPMLMLYFYNFCLGL